MVQVYCIIEAAPRRDYDDDDDGDGDDDNYDDDDDDDGVDDDADDDEDSIPAPHRFEYDLHIHERGEFYSSLYGGAILPGRCSQMVQ